MWSRPNDHVEGVMIPRWTAVVVRLNLRPHSGAHEHAPHIRGASKEFFPMKALVLYFRARWSGARTRDGDHRVAAAAPTFWILHAR